VAKVVIAEEAGACYGVERALRMVQEAVEKNEKVCTLGPLIHNPRVVDGLASRGVRVVSTPEEAAGSALVLRTHGVTPDEERRAREVCSKVIDATCPFVKKVHQAVERLAKDGYQVVIVGEAGHPEVVGTLAHAPQATVIASAKEAERLPHAHRMGVVVQTTQSIAVLRECVGALLARCDELHVVNTICEATSGHQGACAKLARQADVMVVIGGRNSANTTHLAEIARKLCPSTHHIEGADELSGPWFSGAKLIGVTAGASTPAAQINDVAAAIRAMVGEQA
jgi:4-hydroxy-3-methylbut-2-enyl diphosphate reductase